MLAKNYTLYRDVDYYDYKVDEMSNSGTTFQTLWFHDKVRVQTAYFTPYLHLKSHCGLIKQTKMHPSRNN